MPTIALLSDFGLSDSFVGVMKGVILGINPRCQIVDITHQVPPQDITAGIYHLMASYRYFPPKTIFLAIVDPGVGSSRCLLVLKTKSYYFIAPDNGILSSVITCESSSLIRRISPDSYTQRGGVSATFHGRDIIAPLAAELSLDQSRFQALGELTRKFQKHCLPQALIRTDRVVGEIIYFDHFGNAITNIEKKHLGMLSQRIVSVSVGEIKTQLVQSYVLSSSGICAVINSSDRLEIAVPCGSAQKKFKLKKGMKVYASAVKKK